MGSRIPKLLAALGAAVFAAWTCLDRELLFSAFSRVSYYCMAAIFASWAVSLALFLRDRRERLAALLSGSLPGLLFSVGLASLMFLSARPAFRVLSDETNLLGVSRTMWAERRADNVTIGKNYYLNFNPILREREKRPFMFPFLVSLVHSASGYRPSNVFVFNFLSASLLFFGLFLFFRSRWGPAAGYAAPLLAASQPLVPLCAASGGFEFFFTACLFLCFWALSEHLKEPSESSFLLLFTSLLLAANVRYEGPVFLAAGLAGLLAARALRPGWLASWPVWLTPFMLLPVFWQRICLPTNYENPYGEAVFSLSNALRHTAQFLALPADREFYYPYAVPPILAGLAGAAAFLRRPARSAAVIAAGAMAAHWLVTSAYFLGTPVHQASARFFLPASLFLSLAGLAWLSGLPFFRPRAWALPAAAGALFLFYAPVASQGRFGNALLLVREFSHQAEFLERQEGAKDSLVIAERPGQFTALGYGAVDFAYARVNSAALILELERRLFSRIFVFQEISYDTGLPTFATELPPQFRLRTLFELQNSPVSFLRVSEAERAPLKPGP